MAISPRRNEAKRFLLKMRAAYQAAQTVSLILISVQLLELITGNNRPFAPISISSDFSADPGQFTLISLNALTSCEFQGLVLLLTGK